MIMTPEDLRKKFPALSQAADDELSLLLEQTSRVERHAGTRLIGPSKPNESLFLILDGRVRLSLESEDECSIIGDLGPGQWFGEMGMIEPATAVANVMAVEDCVLLQLRRVDFMALRRRSPTLTSVLLHMLCDDMADRLHATIRFIDQEGAAPGADAPDEVVRKWMTDTARKLIGIAARTGA